VFFWKGGSAYLGGGGRVRGLLCWGTEGVGGLCLGRPGCGDLVLVVVIWPLTLCWAGRPY
jgi:hypothetical protein